MKYIENTTEYKFVCKQTYGFFNLHADVEYKLKVINREYEPQHRTVRYYQTNLFGKGHEHFLFPTTIFNTYLITCGEHFWEKEINFYQFLFRDKEQFRCLYTKSILADGVVCLGPKTNNNFVNSGPPLPMDEFVSEFWLTKFNLIHSVGLNGKRDIELRVTNQLQFPFGDFMPTDSYATNEFVKI